MVEVLIRIFNFPFSILASLIFVTTRHSSSKLDSALAAPKIQFSLSIVTAWLMSLRIIVNCELSIVNCQL